jgi:MarR family transcriptional regulator, organic hydroperoxide resistance regulator
VKDNVIVMNQLWTDIYYYLRYPHHEKISHQSVRIMQVIEKEKEVGIKEIAEVIQVSHNTASEHIKRLLEKQYVIKRRSRKDERRVILKLTSLGCEILHRHSNLDEGKLTDILNTMTEEERKSIIDAFTLLKEKAESCTRL